MEGASNVCSARDIDGGLLPLTLDDVQRSPVLSLALGKEPASATCIPVPFPNDSIVAWQSFAEHSATVWSFESFQAVALVRVRRTLIFAAP